MSDPNAVPGQVALLTIAGAGSFGVTKVEPHRTFVNADTTVTQFNWEQFTPIVRGMTLDVSVPMSKAMAAWVDDVFDNASFGGGGTIQPSDPGAVACSLSSNPDGGETFSADFLLDDYRVTYESKDAARVVFTIRATGEVTA